MKLQLGLAIFIGCLGTVYAADPTGCPEFSVDLPRTLSGPVIRATDYGFSTASSNNAAALTAAFQAARALGAHRVLLAPGTYLCHDRQGVRAEGLKDVEIDGAGAVLVFYRPSDFHDQPQWVNPHSGSSFFLHDCTRVVIRNLHMDWDWERDPLAAFVRVEAKNEGSRGQSDSSLDLVFEDYVRHPLYGQPMPVQTFAAIEESHEGFRPGEGAYFGQSEGHFGCRMRWLSENRIRVWPYVKSDCGPYSTQYLNRGTAENNYLRVKARRVGELIRLAHYYYGKNCFVVENGSHITFDAVNIYSTRGMGWVFDGTIHHVYLRQCNVVPPHRLNVSVSGPPKRPITTTADVIHISHGSQGWFKVEDFAAAMNQDDIYNFHDRTTWAAKTAPRALTVVQQRGIAYFKPNVGDEIELLAPDFSTTGFRAHIMSLENETMLLDRDLPDRFREPALVLDRARNTANIHIRNSLHEGASGRCCLLAPNVTLEGLVIRHSPSTGIKLQMATSRDKWSEGYGCTNAIIRHCILEDINGREKRMFGTVCDIFVGYNTNGKTPLGRPVPDRVGDILFEDNTFIRPRGKTIFNVGAASVIERRSQVIR